MKTIIAIPETKEEWKAVWTNNKKKIIGGLAAVGAFTAGAVLTHGKLWGTDGSNSCDSDAAGYLPEGEEETSGRYPWGESTEEETEEQEEANENEADAE